MRIYKNGISRNTAADFRCLIIHNQRKRRHIIIIFDVASFRQTVLHTLTNDRRRLRMEHHCRFSAHKIRRSRIQRRNPTFILHLLHTIQCRFSCFGIKCKISVFIKYFRSERFKNGIIHRLPSHIRIDQIFIFSAGFIVIFSQSTTSFFKLIPCPSVGGNLCSRLWRKRQFIIRNILETIFKNFLVDMRYDFIRRPGNHQLSPVESFLPESPKFSVIIVRIKRPRGLFRIDISIEIEENMFIG